MLVLSRKQNDRIVFPRLGIVLEILRISGNAVRVGVTAPPEIRVLREELLDSDQRDDLTSATQHRRHELRNQLHTANLALHLVQKMLDAGLLADAERTLERALDELAKLEELVATGQPETRAAGGAPTSKRRALLVEDNANERELLAGYLRLHGYEVDMVEDGLAAMRYLADHAKPDCVLLDMQMPRLNGVKTVSAIRRNPAYRGLKLFAVSGVDSRSTTISTGPDGVDRWFSKPLNPNEFVSELDHEMSLAAV